jgi:hypothetical protein
MKMTLIGLAVAISSLAACNSNTEDKTEKHETSDRSITDSGVNVDGSQLATGDISNVTAAYMGIKNALVNDNAGEAAAAGKTIAEAIRQLDENALTADQKKIVAEVKTVIIEHGEHIAENAGAIAHQREHFEMLSKDMYDMVKVFGTSKTMYYAHCPMFNNNKGGSWLSNEKDIKNPYMGQEMVTCGTVKEELK